MDSILPHHDLNHCGDITSLLIHYEMNRLDFITSYNTLIRSQISVSQYLFRIFRS